MDGSTFLLHSLDIFFLLFHSLYTLFNLVGWIWKKTRKIHLLSLGITLSSWIILGFWYGFGYCFCTDWHWQVLYKLGRYPSQSGYIQYLIHRLTGWPLSDELVDRWIWLIMAFVVAASLILNIKDWKAKRDSISQL